MNETINEMIYHSELYFIQSKKMDELIYNYLNINEDDALIESYDDRIEITFNKKKPDNELINKIFKLSKETGTKINANLKRATFQLDIVKDKKLPLN